MQIISNSIAIGTKARHLAESTQSAEYEILKRVQSVRQSEDSSTQMTLEPCDRLHGRGSTPLVITNQKQRL